MTSNPVTVAPGTRVSAARALLVAHRVHHLPVVRGSELVGIVSTTDLRRYGPLEMFAPIDEVDARLDCYIVAEVMTAEPVTLAPDDAIRRAAELFRLDSFSAIPVVDGDELVGIVTCADVLDYLLGLAGATSSRQRVATSRA